MASILFTLYADLAMQPWISAVVLTWLEWYSPHWLRSGMYVMDQVKNYMNNTFFSISKIGMGVVTGEGPPIRTLLWNAFTGDKEANFKLQYSVKDDSSFMNKLWGSIMNTLDSEQMPKLPPKDETSIRDGLIKAGAYVAAGIGAFSGIRHLKSKFWDKEDIEEPSLPRKKVKVEEARYKGHGQSHDLFEGLEVKGGQPEISLLKKIQNMISGMVGILINLKI
jgi:hypothetical protein